MALTNGAGYSISGSTGTRNTIGAPTQWCYGSASQTAVGKITFYLNDVQLFQTTGTFTDILYPIMAQYFDTAQITLTTNSNSVIEMTLPSAFFVDSASATLGADQDTGSSHYYDMFVKVNIERHPDTKFYIEKLTVDAEVHTANYEITTDDVIKITLGGEPTPSTGTRLPPPPIVLGGL